jgi:hypothetical protein
LTSSGSAAVFPYRVPARRANGEIGLGLRVPRWPSFDRCQFAARVASVIIASKC